MTSSRCAETAEQAGALRPPAPPEMLGLSSTHVEALDPDCCAGAPVLLHPAAARGFRALRHEARRAGYDLRAVSGFRSFERQLQIWNEKACGERELLDAEERPLRACELDPASLVEAILRWSALPGLSRHHWGSDLDVIDADAIEPGSAPRLLAADCRGTGCQASLHTWLDAQIAAGAAQGFFRPYTGEGCGVAEEPWHLSFAPLAARCQAALDAKGLRAALDGVQLALRSEVYARLDRILQHYARLPAALYPAPARALLEQVTWA